MTKPPDDQTTKPGDSIDQFNHYRNYLFTVAYRMLGSTMDAEDMVQETFLRWERVSVEGVDSPKSYLVSIITRLCIDHLRSARVQRESYIGPWLPEPLVTEQMPGAEDTVTLADTLSMAFMVLLENLNPIERAAFLLREVFGYSYSEIATIINKSEANCRQLVSRAKKHVQLGKPRVNISLAEQQQLAFQFAAAWQQGDLDSLMTMLTDDVTVWSDGGGKIGAALRPIIGLDKVLRFVLAMQDRTPTNLSVQFAVVNGQPGLISYLEGQPFGVITLDLTATENQDQVQIQGIRILINPDKLQALPPAGETHLH